MHRRPPVFITLLQSAILLGCLILPSPALSKKEHVVHFPNTAYELSIFKIYGKKPGPTLMLIGIIQVGAAHSSDRIDRNARAA